MADLRQIVAAGAASSGSTAIPFAEAQEIVASQHQPETAEDAEASGPGDEWLFWDGQIKAALTHENRWRTEASEVERAYFGPDDDPGRGGDPDMAGKSNKISDETALIHANVDVLKPLIYSETPQPVVRRRFFGDGKVDETALMAAEAGQRIASYILDTSDFDTAMFAARDDWLIAGRGAARALYKARFDEQQTVDPVTGAAVAVEVKTEEQICARALEWRRIAFCPASSWEQMPWLAIEVPMTRTKIAARFGDEVADQIGYSAQGLKDASRGLGDDDFDRGVASLMADTETGTPTPTPFDTTTIWEIWSRETKEVIWWCKTYRDGILDRQDDPLGLEGFFPMPKPLLATTKGQTLTPRPDVRYYQQRAKEVKKATEKIDSILDAMSISGLIPAQQTEDVKKLLSGRNQMIPVAEWTSLLEKGGTANLIQWLPIEQMIKAIQALITMREAAKAAMFEASGVSDVMRAASDPSETATAQQIKGRYAGMRLSERQRTMAIYARDMLRIMVEIALEHFDTATIAEICGLDLPLTEAERQGMIAQQQAEQAAFEQAAALYQRVAAQIDAGQITVPPGVQLPPPPEAPEQQKIPPTSWELVHARLRSDFGRKITITIETQSTVLADEQADKEARIEFLGAFSGFVKELAPMVTSGQFDMKTMKELLLFGVRGFPKSRTLESMISSLPDEVKTPEQKEDTQVIVAKIKAQVDQEMQARDHAHEKEMAQVKGRMDVGKALVQTAADGMQQAAAAPPPQMEMEPANG